MKHINYVYRKENFRKAKLMHRMFMVVMLILCLVSVIGLCTDANPFISFLIGSGSGSLAFLLPITSIDDVSDTEVVGNAIGYRVWLVHVKQTDEDTFPKVGSDRTVTQIPMLPGEYMHYFEGHTVPTFISNITKGDITVEATNTFTMILGGNRAEISNFIENHSGGKFIILFKECESSTTFGLGNPCKPMVLSTIEAKNDADGRYATFTFTNNTVQQPWTYIGGIVKQDPVTLPVDGTTLAIVPGNDQYIIPNGAAASAAIATVTGITAADRGRILTLIGMGTDHPSTLADTSGIILVDGATWTASTGSRLTLRVMDATTLVEVERI